jgi:hypothetical protein
MKNEMLLSPKMEKIALNDPRQIVESMFSIVNKQGKRVPFIFNGIQKDFYNSRSLRDDVLKARKEGMSSLILGILTARFLFVPNIVCACVSHQEKDTQRLFSKVKYFIDSLPFKVTLSRDSAGHLRIEETNSDFFVGTAGSKTFARGDTIHQLHLSEFAFYPSWEMVTGVINAVPDGDRTWVVKETTANGYGNPHHQAWQQEMAGESTFKPHFYGWHQHEEYVMDASDWEMTPDEQNLKLAYDLSDEQLAWRSWKIRSMQPTQDYSREDLFRQEYPISDTEAFLSTGRPVFDPKTLEWYRGVHMTKPILRGTLEGWNPPYLVPNEYGELKVYKDRVAGETYVIGGDVATEGDYSELTVLSRNNMEQVAQWSGRVDEFELANIAFKLGTYYNDALIGIERNNMGIAVVKKLDELGYKKQYMMHTVEDRFKKSKKKLGWETNTRTRPILLGDLNQVFSLRQIIIHDERTISQMASFIKNDVGKAVAQVGAFDDCVISIGIAYQMYKHIPEPVADDEVVVRNYRPNTSAVNLIKKKNGRKNNSQDRKTFSE